MSSKLDPKARTDPKNPKVLNRKVYYPGDKIIVQGDAGDRAFYIESGGVDVLMTEGKTELKIAELKEGDIFGEMALISHDPRTATVIAKETSTITLIERDEIEGQIDAIEDPAIRALIEVLVNRVKETTQGQFEQFKDLTHFQDRITTIIESVDGKLDATVQKQFRGDVIPLLSDLQKVLDRYK